MFHPLINKNIKHFIIYSTVFLATTTSPRAAFVYKSSWMGGGNTRFLEQISAALSDMLRKRDLLFYKKRDARTICRSGVDGQEI